MLEMGRSVEGGVGSVGGMVLSGSLLSVVSTMRLKRQTIATNSCIVGDAFVSLTISVTLPVAIFAGLGQRGIHMAASSALAVVAQFAGQIVVAEPLDSRDSNASSNGHLKDPECFSPVSEGTWRSYADYAGYAIIGAQGADRAA